MDMEKQEEPGRSGQRQRGQKRSLLNANHQRVLAVTLRRLELAAWRLEEQIKRGEPPHLLLTRFTGVPTPQQQTALLALLSQIRREVADLAMEYDLAVHEESLVRAIASEFIAFWCDLEDIRPRKLRDYGDLHPQAEAVLDPPLQRLIALTTAVQDVASGKREAILKWQPTNTP
jgi:hypothetical protein